MSYTQTVYYTFSPDYNSSEMLGDFGSTPWDTVTEIYNHLIAQRLPSCLSWCGDKILGPVEPDEEEQKELDKFHGFDAIREEAWLELCGMSDEKFIHICDELGLESGIKVPNEL